MTPALLMRMSMSSLQPSANSCTDARLARSSCRTSTAPGMAAAAALPLSVSRTARTTCAPAPASIEAAARPMPLLAPVTTTVRSLMSGRWALLEVVMGNNVVHDNNAVNVYLLRYALGMSEATATTAAPDAAARGERPYHHGSLRTAL